jgi:predicted nucleotidyltransferase
VKQNYLEDNCKKNFVKDLVEKIMTSVDNDQITKDDKEYLENESEELVQKLIESKSIVDNQTKEVVKHLVKECVENAATSIESQLIERDVDSSKKSRKEFQGLKDIIYGICDGEYKAKNSPIENAFYTKYYS